jgi:pre-mRNA-splicing factor ATP-dependent RNA helicase DHX15/PRP43
LTVADCLASHRLLEYGPGYFSLDDRSFPDCEARRVLERVQKGQHRSSKRSGNDADKRDKKKRKERR